MSLLEIEGVSIAYGDHRAVDDVSLTIGTGEIVGIVGASGSGKSSLALAAIDLLPDHARKSGIVRFDGRPLESLIEPERDALRGAGIGLILQDPSAALDPRMTIGAQVAEAIRAHRGIGRSAASAEAAAVLHRCGLDPALVPPGRYPHQLSGGQRQRAMIAIAIASSPRLLIADEPATALDAVTQARILDLLRGLVREEGMALMLISHDLALVAGLADRTVVMAGGAIVEQVDTAELLACPRTDYTRELIAASGNRQDRATHPTQPLLEADALTFAYPGTPPAVIGASFIVNRGEILGLVGASGSGKSSLLRLVLGLARPQTGTVRIDGKGIGPASRRRIQGVFQHPNASFDPRWRVREIIAEPLALLPPAERRKELVERVITRVGLPPHLLDRHPHQLSGGEQQRVAIARAIVIAPDLVVLDEATSALDPISRAAIFTLIADLAAQGIAFLIATHDLAMLPGFADRLLVMEEGRIVEQGSTNTLLREPAHPHTRALIAATPELVRKAFAT